MALREEIQGFLTSRGFLAPPSVTAGDREDIMSHSSFGKIANAFLGRLRRPIFRRKG